VRRKPKRLSAKNFSVPTLFRGLTVFVSQIFQSVSNATATCFGTYQKCMRKVIFLGQRSAANNIAGLFQAALGILLIEPHQMLKIGALILPGLQKKIHWFGLNPKKLTPEQSQTYPMLLIHGRCHNQGVWIPLAKAIQKSGLSNPVYTLNLSCNSNVESDILQIEKKLAEIKKQYEDLGVKEVPIDLLGYSAGGDSAYKVGVKSQHHLYHETPFRFDIPSHCSTWYKRGDIGEILLLGEPTSQRPNQFASEDLKNDYERSTFEIWASNDFLVPFSSALPQTRQTRVETTHLGLPFSTDVHQKVIYFMSGRSFRATQLSRL